MRVSGEFLARLGLLGVAGVQSAKCLAEFDLPWHLALGRVIASSHSLPKLDPLAQAHRPIGYMEFVSDLLLYGSMRAGGALALQLLGALCLVLLGLLLFARARDAGATAFFVLAVAIAAFGNWMIVRPATFSFVLLALELWILERHRADPERASHRRLLMLLVPLFVLWVNVHGFATLGLGLLLLEAVYRASCRLARGRLGPLLPERDGKRAEWVAAVLLASLLVSGLNLAGYGFLTAPLHAVNDFSRITEWQTTTFRFLIAHELGVLAFAALATVALIFGREREGGRLPNALDLVMFALALLLARSALRMVPIAVVLTMPFVARRLGAIARPTEFLSRAAGFSMLLTAPIMLVNNPTSFGIGFEPRHFPEAAVRWIERNEPRGRMWNYLDLGGYLAWRLFPKQLVLVDGRSGWVHDPELLQRFHAGLRDREAFRSLTDELELEWAITKATEGEKLGGPLASSTDWTMVYLDDLAAIYVRPRGKNLELAANGYRAIRHLTPLPAVLEAALSGSVPASDLAHDGALSVEQAPSSPRARFFDACGALAVRDVAHFARARAALAQIAPGHPTLAALDEGARIAFGSP